MIKKKNQPMVMSTAPRDPNDINPKFLSREGYADYLTDMRDVNFTKFPNQARTTRDSTSFLNSKGQFVINNVGVSISETSPTSHRLTNKTFVHFGPTSTRTTSKVTKIKGTNKQDFMFGGVNGDKLIGGKGTDFLVGGIGKDILVGGRGNDYFWGGIGSDRYKGLQGKDIFIDFDLYGNADVIADQLRDVEIIGRGPEEYDSTLISHRKGSIIINGWSPEEIADANIF